MSRYNAGDLVFAKMRGYSPWPARIEKLKPEQKLSSNKYTVFFYGTHETANVHAKNIYPYDAFKGIYGKPQKARYFKMALWEIENNSKVQSLSSTYNNKVQNVAVSSKCFDVRVSLVKLDLEKCSQIGEGIYKIKQEKNISQNHNDERKKETIAKPPKKRKFRTSKEINNIPQVQGPTSTYNQGQNDPNSGKCFDVRFPLAKLHLEKCCQISEGNCKNKLQKQVEKGIFKIKDDKKDILHSHNNKRKRETIAKPPKKRKFKTSKENNNIPQVQGPTSTYNQDQNYPNSGKCFDVRVSLVKLDLEKCCQISEGNCKIRIEKQDEKGMFKIKEEKNDISENHNQRKNGTVAEKTSKNRKFKKLKEIESNLQVQGSASTYSQEQIDPNSESSCQTRKGNYTFKEGTEGIFKEIKEEKIEISQNNTADQEKESVSAEKPPNTLKLETRKYKKKTGERLKSEGKKKKRNLKNKMPVKVERRIIKTLSDINNKIKSNVLISNLAIQDTLDVMDELHSLPVDRRILKKKQDLLVTLKECQKLTKSEFIRLRAEYWCNRFQFMSLIKDEPETESEMDISESANA